MGLSPTPCAHRPPNPIVEKSPFKLQLNGRRSTKNIKRHIWKHIGWLRNDAINTRTGLEPSPKAPNEWTQIEHNICGRRAAWSAMWWWPCSHLWKVSANWMMVGWQSGPTDDDRHDDRDVVPLFTWEIIILLSAMIALHQWNSPRPSNHLSQRQLQCR